MKKSLLFAVLAFSIFVNGMEENENSGWINRLFHWHKDVPVAEEIPTYKTLPEAVAANHLQGFRHFLRKNSVNISVPCPDDGNTLLHWAILNGKNNVAAAIMMERGISNVKNHDGKTPEDLAQGTNCEILFAKIYAS